MNEASLMGVLVESLAVAGGATFFAVTSGSVAALAGAGATGWARRAWIGACLLVLALPGFFVAGMWMERVGFAGAWRIAGAESWGRLLPVGISALVLGLMLWPIPALLLAGAIEAVDRRWIEVHPRLRGGELLREIVWPQVRPALAQAAVLVGILAFSNFTVPALFQARGWPAEAWVDFSTRFDAAGAMAKSLVPALLVMAALTWVGRRPLHWPAGEAGASHWLGARLGKRWRLGTRFAALVLLAASAGFPVVELLANPRTWSELVPAWTAAWSAAGRSVGYAAGAATVVGVAGVWLAPSRGGAALACWLAWPGIFVGLALSKVGEWTASTGFRESAGIVWAALALRYGFVGWYVSRRLWMSAQGPLVDWVRTQGGGRPTVWRNVIGPTAGRSWAAGWWIAYVLCLWDVESLILIVPPGGEPLAMTIFNLLHYGHNAQVSALALLLAVAAGAPLVAAGLLRRRGSGAWAAVGRCGVGAALAGLVIGTDGCSPKETERSARLDSKLFERVEVIGAKGTGPGQFVKPRSVVVAADGAVYAVDMTGRVQKFGADGRWLALWQMPETTKGKAKGMALAPEGGVWVVEPHYHRVNRHGADGALLGQWGAHGTNVGQLWFPRAIAPGASNDCYVTEYGVVERVQRFRADGTACLGSFGKAGTGPGELNRAEGLGTDRSGRVYVADSCNHRVQVFDAEGRWLRAHGKAGQGPGEFSYPYDVRVDAEGRQYVCEFGNSRVQVLDAQDRPLEILGGPGAEPGRMNNPWSLCLDGQGNLYVADSLNHRLLKFVRRGGEPVRAATAAAGGGGTGQKGLLLAGMNELESASVAGSRSRLGRFSDPNGRKAH